MLDVIRYHSRLSQQTWNTVIEKGRLNRGDRPMAAKLVAQAVAAVQENFGLNVSEWQCSVEYDPDVTANVTFHQKGFGSGLALTQIYFDKDDGEILQYILSVGEA